MLARTPIAWMLLSAAAAATPQTQVPGLQSPVDVFTDTNGIRHVVADNEHDLLFMQGWVHAQDRFFQMDALRRQASGTLSELFGPATLANDVELRTLGVRRAAQRSEPLMSPEASAGLQAYADGVNAWLASHPLPIEYGFLEVTAVQPWTVLDSLSVAKLLAFGLSFDLGDIGRTEALMAYKLAGNANGFDGTALFFEDLVRSEPFDRAATVPDAQGESTAPQPVGPWSDRASATIDPVILDLARSYLERVEGLDWFQRSVQLASEIKGSNEWVVSGQLTQSGRPILANDPHLALDTPSTFYPMHLQALSAGFDVIGSTFPGMAYVTLGHNERISWGATVNPMDVTDVFAEKVVPDGASPSGLSTVYMGNAEPLVPIPETFRYNLLDGTPDNLATAPPGGAVGSVSIPPATLIVPRRSQGPIVSLNVAAGKAVSVQYSGFHGTREMDAFRKLNLARNLIDFRAGLESFDVGSQNWAYADVDGNIAYFSSAEMPLREDLQSMTVAGLPPYFIRSGAGGNEWMAQLPNHPGHPGQALPYEILPPGEMPAVVNPSRGYFVNANNDPTGGSLDNDPLNQLRPGGGIFYLSPDYAIGTRAGRIERALRERINAGPLTVQDMAAVQADVVMLDAQVFTPAILQAFANGQAAGAHIRLAGLAADPRVIEAVGRLQGWDGSTPTGIGRGFDAGDSDGKLARPSAAEIEASVCATIYSVWRGQMLANTFDGFLDAYGLPRSVIRWVPALRHLLDGFATNQGVGASGVDFFELPGVPDAEDRRDIVILQSLLDALVLLAGPEFDGAFHGSTDQDDYRWGLLHRIVLDHPLGSVFNVPSIGGPLTPPIPGLKGYPVDGGFGVVDASSHSARADGLDEFMFGHGPARRYVAVAGPGGFRGQTSLPGGTSGAIGKPFSTNLLFRWLTNDSVPLLQSLRVVMQNLSSSQTFVP